MTDIAQRLDAAFERARWRYPESPPKRIYLSAEDWRAYDAHVSAGWGGTVHAFSYRDIDIFAGNRSRLVTAHGCLIAVPKRLSPRVKAAA